jgi:hypothetical protein
LEAVDVLISSATPSMPQNAEGNIFNPAAVKEFTPQNYDIATAVSILPVDCRDAFVLTLPELVHRCAFTRQLFSIQ